MATETDTGVEVTLRFRNREERDFFMGGLSDGFGEAYCDLKWEGDFREARTVDVDPTRNELWDHDQEMKRKYPRK